MLELQNQRRPLIDGFGTTFQPIPTLTVSEWAAKYRHLPKSGSSSPGKWRNERTPYLVEIMDCLSVSHPCKEVVFAKGAQIGASEAGLNWIMYIIDQQPGPILGIQPTNNAAIRWSKQRVGPSLELCERLSDKMFWGAGNAIQQKDFVGGTFIISGANSPADLASMPIAYAYFDEVERYPQDAGEEGDPVSLALARLDTFPRSKAFFSSTPAIKAVSRIWPLFEDSDRRYYKVPCPHCNEHQSIDFENLKWPAGEPEKVALACIHCGVLIEEYHKTKMLRNGYWEATNPGHHRVGFHLSSLYSPVGWKSWVSVAREFEAAEGNVKKTKVFINTVLGLPYEETGEQIAAEYLRRRRESYKAEVPEGVRFLTLAVDVQKDWLAYEVCGWGVDEESWGIEYGEIRGDLSILQSRDPSNPSPWEQIDHLRKATYQNEAGAEMRIACTVVDSGGWWTDEVYAFTKPREKLRVFSIKGGSKHDRPLMSKPTRNTKNKAALFVLGVGKGKTLVYQRLKSEKEGAGYCHFPDDEDRGYDPAYYAGLTSEKLVLKHKDGHAVLKWEKPDGVPNEPLDIRVYGTAAIRILNPNWSKVVKQNGYRKKSTIPTEPIPEVKPEETKPKAARKKSRSVSRPRKGGIDIG
ncbi:phage terminase large subunit family protein [Budviciaceae bacterium CWB-B4]|uniref:Phage terminase large subunit family protein n=1 Tax=Limnobaculum xujianqingii TaxID=2738837 RepID=A0A9D7AIJ4_9GAMM|nr:phage terminase large subunit family protein [Limnobaculum xujianqingii]MBK5073238.1 phage terminase large subunit family protein [Limnobaculum xujianqingii]MBK5176547.1 phage terminase large subunit family protein [Limnobaculum xujianqingii]